MIPSKILMTKIFTFEAAHQLPNHNGKCKFLHGHSYRLETVFESNIKFESVHGDSFYTQQGFLVDFSEIKDLVKSKIIDKFDHKCLNDYFEIPSAEEVAFHCFTVICGSIKANPLFRNVKLCKITLWETETSYVTMEA
mgnify:CR=1 FL=1